MRAQRLLDDMQLAVERHLAQLSRVAQIFAFEFLHVVVERLVGAHLVRKRVQLQQAFGQLVLFDQPMYLFDQRCRISGKVVRR